MAHYFDTTSSDDVKLLNANIRTNSELANVANATEDYLRSIYTAYNETDNVYEVKLRGYADDPANADAGFKQAYKQTIADAISFVLLNYQSEKSNLTRDKRGQREQNYTAGFNPDNFPYSLFRRLILYDMREPVYGI